MTHADAAMVVRELDAGGLVRVNPSFTEQFGFDAGELVEKPLITWIEPDRQECFRALLDAGQGGLRAGHLCDDGSYRQLEWLVKSEDGTPVVFGRVVPDGDEDEADALASTENDSQTVSGTLETIARIVEDQNPGYRCSILLLDKTGRIVSGGAGPSLPATYNAAVEGLAIGPMVGSCGTAAYWDEPVVVEDIQADLLWRDLAAVAKDADVASCWSHPFSSRDGRVLGALALYSREPSSPSAEQLSRLKAAARMTGLAVERGRAEEALRRSDAEARHQTQLLEAVTKIVTDFVSTEDWGSAGREIVESALALTGCELGFLGVVEGDAIRLSVELGDSWPAGPTPVHRGEDDEQGGASEPLGFSPGVQATLERAKDAGETVRVTCDDEAGAELLVRDLLVVPVVEGGAVLALVALANSPAGFGQRDIESTEALAQAARVTLDRHRRTQREHELEEQLRQAAKLEALGVLAGGIAHDFNNLLATVQGNAELLHSTLPRDEEALAMLDDIITASGRAAEFCNQMLAYSGRGTLTTTNVEVNSLLMELGGLLRVSLSKKATLAFGLHAEPLHVLADASQLRQVAMNLVTNAAEALGESVGRIQVNTSETHLDAEGLSRLAPGTSMAEGDYLQLVVSDTGMGMTPEVQARIFDPFFTTKFTGRGLGLAAVKGIIRNHGGEIQLRSTPGEGTTFTVYLPLSNTSKTVSEGASEDGREDKAGGLVLVVDDEDKLRSVVVKILKHSGYSVLEAEDGQEALDILGRDPSAVDCVLLDLSMPKLDGAETYHGMRALRADLPVVLVSGYTEKEVLDRFKGSGLSGVLQKPVPNGLLLATLRRAMAPK